jgi:hypothetical protein
MGQIFINPTPKYNIPPVEGVELQKIQKQEPLNKTGIIEEKEDGKFLKKKKRKNPLKNKY